jgi:hypothetical protein
MISAAPAGAPNRPAAAALAIAVTTKRRTSDMILNPPAETIASAAMNSGRARLFQFSGGGEIAAWLPLNTA